MTRIQTSTVSSPTIKSLPFVLPMLVAVYVLALAGFLLAQASPLGEAWFVQLAAVFAPWLYLPLPALAVFALLGRQRHALVVLVLPLVFFVAQFGPRFAPQPAPAERSTLRVMTWNTLFHNADVHAALDVIRAQNPDVLALQELGTDMAPGLAEALATSYPYQALWPRSNPDGFGIFTRYPIVRAEEPALGVNECRCQRVDLVVDGVVVTLFNVHPHIPSLRAARLGPLPVPADFSTEHQNPSFQALLRQLEQTVTPVVIAGDLNTTDQQPNYRLLRSRLTDSFGEAGFGFGFTFPYRGRIGPAPAFPVVRLDYILHDGAWRTDAAWTGAGAGSDHGFVVADLTLDEHRDVAHISPKALGHLQAQAPAEAFPCCGALADRVARQRVDGHAQRIASLAQRCDHLRLGRRAVDHRHGVALGLCVVRDEHVARVGVHDGVARKWSDRDIGGNDGGQTGDRQGSSLSWLLARQVSLSCWWLLLFRLGAASGSGRR
jgi:vancomycin resistance protein VanJ